MKKNLLTIIAVMATIFMMVAVNDTKAQGTASASNIVDNERYTYEITEVTGKEIHGVPLDNIDEGNQGILLFDNEVSFDVHVGDIISVQWGEHEDEFQSIEKAVQTEDGSYVPESFYQ